MRTPLILAFLLASAASAFAAAHRYVGIHPIAKSHGDGICYIEGPHVHVYEADKLQYRDHDGAYFFVGDPVAYGYEGPKHAYKGHHPIHVHAVVGTPAPDVEYCYLDGPHYHYFQPPPGPEFKVAGGAYFYVGEPPRAYVEARPMYVGINAVYTPFVYARPTIAVVAPVGWIGARAEFVGPGVAVVAPRAVVTAPGVHVHAGVGVSVGVGVGVGIGIGGPAVVVPGGRVRVKHDNGRHRGHRKHR
jgi:hypothetical protein